MNKTIVLILFTAFIVSCKRERADRAYPALVGTWEHYTSATDIIYLSIESDSRGDIEYYENNKFDHDTQPRKWFVNTKKNKLIFGRMSNKKESFIIDSLPVVSTRFFIDGYDTLKPGDRYMILDGGLFVDRN